PRTGPSSSRSGPSCCPSTCRPSCTSGATGRPSLTAAGCASLGCAPGRTDMTEVQRVGKMKAAVYRRYGTAEVLRIEEVDKPEVGDSDVLVRVRATSINQADWHTMTGTPLVARIAFGLRGPKDEMLGGDFAGTVEAVGSAVSRFKSGDAVFGLTRSGAFAEYVSVPEDRGAVAKPDNVSFEEAGTVGVAGITAWGECKRVLKPEARLVVVGGPSRNVLLGPVSHLVGMRLAAIGDRRKIAVFIATVRDEDLEFLRELLQKGQVKPVIEKRYDFADIGQAMAYLGEGHARAKLAVTI